MKAVFLLRSIDRPNMLRGYLLGHAIADGNSIVLAGPCEKNCIPYLKPFSKNVKLIAINPPNQKFTSPEYPKSQFQENSNSQISTIQKISCALLICKSADTVIVSEPSLYSVLSALICKLQGKRFVLDIGEEHVELSFDLPLELGRFSISKIPKILKLFPRYLISCFNYASRHFADATTVSSNYLQKKYGGTIVRAPVNLQFFNSKKLLSQARRIRQNLKGKLIVCTGSIQIFKGFETLINAFPLVKKSQKNAKLLLVGYPATPEFYQSAKALASSLSQDIHFLGHVSYENSLSFCLAADCLVFPTSNNILHRSQSPIKLLNYMATGKPIVANSVGDAAEILGHGKAGILVEPGNPDSMAIAILKALNEKKLAKQLAWNAKKLCKEKYSVEVQKAKLNSLIFSN